MCRFILCVSLLYRIVWVIAHQAKRTKIWPLPPRSRGYRSHQREGCDLGPSPRGATLDLKTDIQAAGPLSLIDWSMPRPTRACRSFQRERRTTGFIQRPGHCFRLQRPGATGRQMVHPKVHTGVLVLGLSGLASAAAAAAAAGGTPTCMHTRASAHVYAYTGYAYMTRYMYTADSAVYIYFVRAPGN